MLFSLLGLLLPLTASACGGGQAGDRSIVLDRSIGGVALKEKRSEVERRLGDGVVVRTQDQKPPEPSLHVEQVKYPKQGLEVVYVSRDATPLERARGRVYFVRTASPRYRTTQGIHVGSPATSLRSISGLTCFTVECQHGYHANGLPGTTFRIDAPHGHVLYIALAFGH